MIRFNAFVFTFPQRGTTMFDRTQRSLLAMTAAATALVACGGGAPVVRLPGNLGPVGTARAFEVAVSNLDTTATFSWPGGVATTLVVVRSGLDTVVWGAQSSGAGFASPVTLNVLPEGATAKTVSMGPMIGGQTFEVIIERADGKVGSQKFQPPMSVGLGGVCTPTSAPSAHHGHCVYPLAGKGDLCTHYTGTSGENVSETQHTCTVMLKGTYGEGVCPPSKAGQCLSRCGAPIESLDTVYFATPAEWKGACAARKGTYIEP
jgi:hypothetical protein